METTDVAINLTKQLASLLKEGGFHFQKWMSNSAEVQQAISGQSTKQNMDLSMDETLIQRTLGLQWKTAEDISIFSPEPKDNPHTKRGVVSTVCSIFDPYGFLAPFTFRAKCFIQELWRSGIALDENLPPKQERRWNDWVSELKDLKVFMLPQHHPEFTASATNVDIHVFVTLQK